MRRLSLRFFPYQPHWTDLKGSGNLTPIEATVQSLCNRLSEFQGGIWSNTLVRVSVGGRDGGLALFCRSTLIHFRGLNSPHIFHIRLRWRITVWNLTPHS